MLATSAHEHDSGAEQEGGRPGSTSIPTSAPLSAATSGCQPEEATAPPLADAAADERTRSSTQRCCSRSWRFLNWVSTLPSRSADACSNLTGRVLVVWPLTSLVLMMLSLFALAGAGQLYAPIWPLDPTKMMYGYNTQGTPMALRETQLMLLLKPMVNF